MSTNVTLHAGHDVAYFTSGRGRGGCAGAMSYYTAAGEPPGQWAGKGAAALGLSGQVDPEVIGRLYQHNIGPGGELLVKRRQSKAADEREEVAVSAYQTAHPYASATELAGVRAAERAKDPHQVPYFDLTVSAVKSVSVLHASYRVSARQAREHGDDELAAALDAKADELEDALMEAAREAVGWLERHAACTRTGHHSARTGEWRDGAGLAAGVFPHHLSRDGDPQLHVHVAIWNRIQRADGTDRKWRTLDSRTLHHQRLGVAPVADRILEARLTALGYVMVPRADGNGAEVGGVSQDVMDLFSSRAVAVTSELTRLAREYQDKHGKPPDLSPSWLWLELPLMLLLVGLFAWAVSGRRLLRVRRVPAWRSATIGVQGADSYTAFGYANPTRRVLAGVLHTRAEVREIMMEDHASDDGSGAPDRADVSPDAAAHLRYASDVMEVVETYLYRPALGSFTAIVSAAKRLQSGRLDAWTPTCCTCSSPWSPSSPW